MVGNLLTLKITGSNEGRYERYCARIGKTIDDKDSYVDYSANIAGNWDFGKYNKNSGLLVKARPVFYETTYQVRCQFALNSHVENAYVLHEMKSIADEFYYENNLLDGRLDFVNSPGRFTFDIVYLRHHHEEHLRLIWWVVSEKIDVIHDANEIKAKIEEANKGFVYTFLSKTKNNAGISKLSSVNNGEWLDIFRNFVEQYKTAINCIVNSPHLRYRLQEQYERSDRIKQWSPALANQFNSFDTDRKERYLFRIEQVSPNIDTTENRFVLFTLKKITTKLEMLEARCRESSEIADTYTAQLTNWHVSLMRLMANPFFKKISCFTGLHQENLVLQRKRGYSKIFETWLALQHAIDVTKNAFDAGNRPIWKLYEFWCFLVIRDFLKSKQYKIDENANCLGSLSQIKDIFNDVDPEADEKDTSHEKGSNKCEYVFDDAGLRTITLTYQQSYSNSSIDDVDNSKIAHIVEQIPDIVMTIHENKTGNEYTYLFDAKYQNMSLPNDTNPQTDAAPYRTINEMHRYRDAILYRKQKSASDAKGHLTHEIIGAFVLYPGRIDKSFDYKTFIVEENIGAIPVTPGKGGLKELNYFLESILDRKDAPAHLDSAIPTRGTSLVVGDAHPEYVIVGYCKSDDHLKWIEKGN